MASEWFCKISGEKYGPLSPKQLKGMATKGEIAPDDWVKQGEDGSWVAAAQIKGLFGAAGPAKATPAAASPTAKAKPLPVAKAAPIPPASPAATSPQTASLPPVARATPIAATSAPQAVVPQAAASADAFGIVTDADRPVASSSSPSSSTYIDAKTRRKKRSKTVGGLVALVIGIAVVGIILVVFVGREPDVKTPQTEPGTAAEEEILKDFSATAPAEEETPVEPEADKPASDQAGPTSSVQDNTPQGTMVDASRETFYLAPLAVRVKSVRVLKPEMQKVDEEGNEVAVRARTVCTIIALQITNTQAEGEVRYLSWTSQRMALLKRKEKISLSDDKDGNYPPIRVGAGRTLPGQTDSATIPPGKSITDVLIFAKPAEDVEYLELKLPASVFRRKGTLGFKIPAEMIKKEEILQEPAQTSGGDTPLPNPDQPDPFQELDEKK